MKLEHEGYENDNMATHNNEDMIELTANEIVNDGSDTNLGATDGSFIRKEEESSQETTPNFIMQGQERREEERPNFIMQGEERREEERPNFVMQGEERREEERPNFVMQGQEKREEEERPNFVMQGQETNRETGYNSYQSQDGFVRQEPQGHTYREQDNIRKPATYRFSNEDRAFSQQNQQYSYQNNSNGAYFEEQQSNGGNSMPPKRKKNNTSFGKQVGKLVASAAIFGVVAGLCFQGVQYGTSALFPQKQASVQLPTTSIANGTSVSTKGSVSQVANSSMPAIVAITSTVESIQNGFFGQQYRTEGTGSGSGIIISKDKNYLYIATNHHVVDGAKKVQVTFYHDPNKDGSGEIVDATIVGNDPDSDLAVVKVELKNMQQDTLNEIKVAALGTSKDIEIGQQVVAIGNALGYGQSVTGGYISALNRQVQLEDKTMTLMQTDAAINPGNSGGALINMNGEVIGINSAKYSESGVEGMGYAIPMDTARPILEDIMNESSVPEDQQAYLGITGATISDEYRQYMGNHNIPSGVYVATVTSGSPAEQGGLYANDIITKLNDREVSTMEGLQSILARKKAGDEVTLTVKRQNQNGDFDEKTLTVRLGKKTEAIKAQQEQQTQQEQQQREYYQRGNSRNSFGEDEFWSFFN